MGTFGKDIDEGALQASGVIGSILGAVIALLVYRGRKSTLCPLRRIAAVAHCRRRTYASPSGH